MPLHWLEIMRHRNVHYYHYYYCYYYHNFFIKSQLQDNPSIYPQQKEPVIVQKVGSTDKQLVNVHKVGSTDKEKEPNTVQKIGSTDKLAAGFTTKATDPLVFTLMCIKQNLVRKPQTHLGSLTSSFVIKSWAWGLI